MPVRTGDWQEVFVRNVCKTSNDFIIHARTVRARDEQLHASNFISKSLAFFQREVIARIESVKSESNSNGVRSSRASVFDIEVARHLIESVSVDLSQTNLR